MRKLIAPLADPASFGGDAADAFDVIVPSLPGFGFSSPLEAAGMNFFATAHLWVELMDRLGYGRFATQGGDFGGMVAAMLGHAYPDRVIGAHLHYIAPLKPPYPEPEDYAPHEAWYPDKAKKFAEQQIGYQAIQRTKPQTPAFALNDSPVGLAAWLVEKRYHWADVREGLEAVFSKDDLLNTAMIYWLTETYVTSARYYYEARPGNAGPVHNRLPVVEAPVAVLQFLEDVKPMPRKWAERYYNLKRWNLADKGGHFAPMEAPELMIGDIRAFFRELR
jgi:pimeloyl-ACP methyl ester carboxylesterase